MDVSFFLQRRTCVDLDLDKTYVYVFIGCEFNCDIILRSSPDETETQDMLKILGWEGQARLSCLYLYRPDTVNQEPDSQYIQTFVLLLSKTVFDVFLTDWEHIIMAMTRKRID